MEDCEMTTENNRLDIQVYLLTLIENSFRPKEKEEKPRRFAPIRFVWWDK